MIQFNAYLECLPLYLLEIIITVLTTYAVYVGYVYTYSAVGQKRLTIYISIALCLLVCLIASFYLKQVFA